MKLDSKELARMIDLSCVRADSTLAELSDAVALAKRYDIFCLFALPAHTAQLVEMIADRDDMIVGGVVGFPDGGATTAGKVSEAKELIAAGVSELDMVNNIAWLKGGDDTAYEADIRAVVETGAQAGIPVKVILECHYLTDAEISRACELAANAGAAWVKTGTGWAPTGATLENVALMKKTVGERCKVKAAGGVRDIETIEAMIDRGVERFGIGVRTAQAILEGLAAPADATY
ncbi:MAG: deoxyribose-phosphate aldolase [Phycisphaerales bacterium]|jgi:deoxyribose-phosphate aldolase|nr:deoxyribose-phosphate aldolase [Phycisphaerales bacterium]MBT7171963.1 deoxyribose-phosphate aldolase [Phycisphaerales bacterium]